MSHPARWYRLPMETCSRCGRKVAAYVPKDGDGSANVARIHNDPRTGERCDGSRQETVESQPERLLHG